MAPVAYALAMASPMPPYPPGRSHLVQAADTRGAWAEGLGIPTIEVSEYLEEHPLGRAEWLRFFGVLFGEERLADSLFAGIRERYEAIRVDSAIAERPTVLFGSVWNGQWWVPPGNSYMARLIEDAGGRYVFADQKGDGNVAVDMETMITVGKEADVWGMVAQLDPFVTDLDFTHGDPRLAGFKCMKDQRLFVGNTTVSDIFGTALIDPDGMLRDMKAVLRGRKDRDAVRPARYFDDVHFKPSAQ